MDWNRLARIFRLSLAPDSSKEPKEPRMTGTVVLTESLSPLATVSSSFTKGDPVPDASKSELDLDLSNVRCENDILDTDGCIEALGSTIGAGKVSLGEGLPRKGVVFCLNASCLFTNASFRGDL